MSIEIFRKELSENSMYKMYYLRSFLHFVVFSVNTFDRTSHKKVTLAQRKSSPKIVNGKVGQVAHYVKGKLESVGVKN